MDNRDWQAGDLVQEPDGDWLVLSDEGAAIVNRAGDGLDTLLAAGDADLWTALQGLPSGGLHSNEGCTVVGLGPYGFAATIRQSDMDCVFHLAETNFRDTAPLKQAIQRFEAIAAYIAAKDVQNG